MSHPFPDLPIIQPPPPDAPRRTQAEKYGAAFYISIAGLLVVLAIIGVFAWGVFTMRGALKDVYILNDAKQPLETRVEAARRLSRDTQFSPQQRWELAISRVPPEPARRILAASLREEVVTPDPELYILKVARSEGWPTWLRRSLVRPIAYAADQTALPREALEELGRGGDAVVALWATYARAASSNDPASADALRAASIAPGDASRIAKSLVRALDSPKRSSERRVWLDKAATEAERHAENGVE